MSIFGWSYPPGCSGTPYDEGPDEDEVCAWCGSQFPLARPNPLVESWESEGVCDAKCAILLALSDLGVAAGLEPPKGITAEYRDKILKVVAELEPRRCK